MQLVERVRQNLLTLQCQTYADSLDKMLRVYCSLLVNRRLQGDMSPECTMYTLPIGMHKAFKLGLETCTRNTWQAQQHLKPS